MGSQKTEEDSYQTSPSFNRHYTRIRESVSLNKHTHLVPLRTHTAHTPSSLGGGTMTMDTIGTSERRKGNRKDGGGVREEEEEVDKGNIFGQWK